MVLVVVVRALLAHADVLTDGKMVASWRIRQEFGGFLKKLAVGLDLGLSCPLVVFFGNSLHIGYRFGIRDQLGFVLLVVGDLSVVLQVTDADHFVDIGLGGFEGFRFDTDLL